MNSLTAVLAWDYLRRNYVLLLACFLVALCSIVPSSSLVAGYLYDELPEFRAMSYNSVIITPIVIILLGMTFTQPQIERHYLKPISNVAIVIRYYSLGALLTAIQIAIVVGLWKRYYNLADWPILQPVLLATICWGFICPFFLTISSTILRARRSLDVFIIYYLALGIWLFAGDVMIAPKEEAATSLFRLGLTPTLANISFATVVLVVGFYATLRQIIQDRCDCCLAAATNAINEKTQLLLAAKTFYLRSFATSRDAYQDFDFRYRTVPTCFIVCFPVMLCCLFLWMISDVGSGSTSILSTSTESPPGRSAHKDFINVYASPGRYFFWIALTWFFPTTILTAICTLIFLRIPIPKSLISIFWTPELNNILLQYHPYNFDSSFHSLPISDQDIVDGKLRSSFVAVAYVFPVVLFLGIIFSTMVLAMNNRVTLVDSVFTRTPGYIIFGTAITKSLTFAFASVGTAFVILSIQSLINAFLMSPWRWIVPAIAFLVAYFSNFPFAYSLGVALLLLLGVVAYTYTEFTDGDRERLSKAGKLIPGIVGGSFALLTVAGYADAFSFHQVAVVLFSLAIALTLMAITALATELTVPHFRRS